MIHEKVLSGPLEVNCHILALEAGGEAVAIDPGGSEEAILRQLEKHNLTLTHILATHGHFDHIGGAKGLQDRTQCKFMIHAADNPLVEAASIHAAGWGIPFAGSPLIDADFEDGQTVEAAGISFEVIHTPGHTQGGVCLRWENEIAVGDTIFAGSIGRTDLPGGDYEQLITAIKTRLLPLPDELVCHPGHGPSTSIGTERRVNPFLSGA